MSIDARASKDSWGVYSDYGKNPIGETPSEFAKKVQDYGAGEILINSIDNDGAGNGYDIKLVKSVVDSVSIPVIALGGAGVPEHFSECIDSASPDAIAASNIFQYTENSYFNINRFLYNNSFNVRRPELETIFEAGDN